MERKSLNAAPQAAAAEGSFGGPAANKEGGGDCATSVGEAKTFKKQGERVRTVGFFKRGKKIAELEREVDLLKRAILGDKTEGKESHNRGENLSLTAAEKHNPKGGLKASREGAEKVNSNGAEKVKRGKIFAFKRREKEFEIKENSPKVQAESNGEQVVKSTDNGVIAPLNVISDAQKQEVVEEYLKRVVENSPRVVFGGGGGFTSPPKRPNSLEEASQLTRAYLERKI